jgi:UDP-N-acetylglucosamine 2-epimerase (non-hydrolysing)
MIDSLLTFRDKADESSILTQLGLRTTGNGNNSRPYALLTLHRPANVDNADSFVEILEGLRELSASYPVVFPAHPRTQKRIHEHWIESYFIRPGEKHESFGRNFTSRNITVIEPLGYLDFLCVMKHAALVVTDSGGIQEETSCLGVPCVTVRENTERPVTMQNGTNVLGGVRREGIRKAVQEQLGRRQERRTPEKWDGRAAERIVEVLIREHARVAGKTTTPRTNGHPVPS